MDVLDFLYLFVPLFAFTAFVELIHLVPFISAITQKRIYERMYDLTPLTFTSLLFFEASFLVEMFLESKALYKLFELTAMGLILFLVVVEIRKNLTELQITTSTHEILERSEKRYRNLIETMNDGFWVIDKDRTTTMVNKKIAEMLGYIPPEMIGKDALSFMDEKEQAKVKEHLKQRAKGISSTYEIAFTKKDGSKLPVVISASPLFDENGAFAGSFAIVTDISNRKEMEEKITQYSQNLEKMVEERTNAVVEARDSLMNMLEDLTESKEKLAKAYDELKDVDRLKTDIISNVSHELRTPITIAKSTIELMREEKDQKEIERFLTMCENALTRLNDLVDNLVDVSFIYKGQFAIESSILDLNTVVKEVLQSVEAFAREKKIRLNFTPKKDLPGVKADRQALKRALINLVENAIKFNRPEGEVEIEAKKDGDFIQISIRDTGIGIEPQYKEKIFEPFYQIDPTSTREYGGTGIGLSIVKAHVEAQRGRVWFESTMGKGSTFYIKLPAVKRESFMNTP